MNGPTHGGVVCGCGRIMRAQKNDVAVEELLEDGGSYRLWFADLYRCPDCNAEVITGFGRAPLVEHWQSTYEEKRARLHPVYLARSR